MEWQPVVTGTTIAVAGVLALFLGFALTLYYMLIKSSDWAKALTKAAGWVALYAVLTIGFIALTKAF